MRELILSLVLLISCTANGQKNDVNPAIVSEKLKIQGFVVPSGNISAPTEITAGKPNIVRAEKPRVVRERVHTKNISEPFINNLGIPKIYTPGQNGVPNPEKRTSSGISFPAAAPEVVIAKDPGSKDFNPHGFSSFGTIQGLKTNHIRCMLQDRNGNLWFSNDEGVTRYDGKYLAHFEFPNGIYQNNIILCMLEDQEGSLWFGTFGGGVVCFNGKNFTQYTEAEGLSNNTVNSIIQDKSGYYWMATSGGGISRFDGKEFTNYTTSQGLAGDQVRAWIKQ